MATTQLDPQMKIMLDVFNAAGPMFLRAETAEQARAKMRALLEANPIPPPEIYRVEDRKIPGADSEVAVRVYTPEGNPPMGVLVFFHGGGWVLGDLESHDRVCRALANLAGCVTVAIDYRLAPEHVFPAGAEDCWRRRRLRNTRASNPIQCPLRVVAITRQASISTRFLLTIQ